MKAPILVLMAVGVGALPSPALGATLSPQALHAAYALPTASATRQTVAVVVAYDAPTVAPDLATFSRRFHLPACAPASGCLRRMNQRGAPSPLPPRDPTGGNWISEAALSTQTVHGLCQNCRLLVVEADSEDKADLAAAVDTAVRLGADEVVTSFGFVEGAFDAGLAPHYDHPGVAITAATGDRGFAFGTDVPATYPGVVAVGGTDLRVGADGRRRGESVWSDSDGASASGCSFLTAAPPWQLGAATQAGCETKRALADVAAVAAPGVALYSSSPITAAGDRGWFEVGGTSLASPIVAATFALAGGVPAGVRAPSVLYAARRRAPAGLHDIVTGANGSCSGRPICRARPGYDGPTGLGTPNGLAAFRAGRARTLDPAAPRVALRVPGGRLRFDGRGRARVTTANGNPFSVRVSLRLRSVHAIRASAGSRRRRVTFSVSPRSFSLRAQERRGLGLRLTRTALTLLRRQGHVPVDAVLTARDAHGNRADVRARLSLALGR